MKKVCLVSFALAGMLLLSGGAMAQSKKKAAVKTAVPVKVAVENTVTLKNYQDSVNYALGMSMGRSLVQFNVKNVDITTLSKGIADMISGKPESYMMTEGKAMQLMQTYFSSLRDTEMNNELKKGQAFLAANKAKTGVVELPSGLQYKIITPGDMNSKPVAEDTVVVNYRGTTIDGKEFDSSYKHGEPVTFPLNRVIKGWTEGVQQVGKGGKIMLYIPAELAYGERGAGKDIPGNAALIFEIELLDVKKAQ